ncbi:MAG TPA: HAD family phosphatase [Alphaproteobacteria bacterium]|nr:HAD family phosphatase [Alphaproteobacteria bacterium]
MPKFELLAFDLDGTMADTERVSLPDAIDMLNSEFNIPVTLDFWFTNYHGLAGQPLLDALARDFGVVIANSHFIERRNARIRKVFTSQPLPAAPGLYPTLRQLAAGGYQMAICSNSQPERVHLTISHLAGQTKAGLHLTDMFEGCCFSGVGSTHEPKPAPDVYLAALAQFKIAPTRALAVEDSATGVVAAHKAGMPCVGFTGLARHPEEERARLEAAGVVAIMADWAEFPAILAKLEK